MTLSTAIHPHQANGKSMVAEQTHSTKVFASNGKSDRYDWQRVDGAPRQPDHLQSFETRLIEMTQPLRYYMLAINLYHLFATGLFDTLHEMESITVAALAERHTMEGERLAVFIKYLRNEGYIEEADKQIALSAKGRSLVEFRPWYTMLVGGYAETLLQIGEKLQLDSGVASRNLARVGEGSCGISHYDAIPVTRRLMAQAADHCTRMLDMGCGNARYLVEFCQALPEIEAAWGVEPSLASCQEAATMVRHAGLQDRIQIIQSGAVEFLRNHRGCDPNFAVLGFVLHEILGQEGKAGVCDFLRHLFQRFPDLHLIVIEVDNQMDRPGIMQHGLALAYYNAYYLWHPFTNQRLETLAFWEELFAECQLEIVAKEYTDPRVDSTGLEVGYLLRKQTF